MKALKKKEIFQTALPADLRKVHAIQIVKLNHNIEPQLIVRREKKAIPVEVRTQREKLPNLQNQGLIERINRLNILQRKSHMNPLQGPVEAEVTQRM